MAAMLKKRRARRMPTSDRRSGGSSDPMPTSIRQISKAELAAWSSVGPLVGDGHDLRPEAPMCVWATWDSFFRFYKRVRAEYVRTLPRSRQQVATVERLFCAWAVGDDVDELHRQIIAERAANDPRRMFDRA